MCQSIKPDFKITQEGSFLEKQAKWKNWVQNYFYKIQVSSENILKQVYHLGFRKDIFILKIFIFNFVYFCKIK